MATQERPVIAVVDDEESVRRALARLLSASNFDVKTFQSGNDFLDALPAWQPHCIVLDHQMPGITGLDLLGELARSGSKSLVIMITGQDEAEIRSRCLASGRVLAYLSKPIDETDFLSAVRAAVEKSGLTP
jgi:FixJ family two-component response regulator